MQSEFEIIINKYKSFFVLAVLLVVVFLGVLIHIIKWGDTKRSIVISNSNSIDSIYVIKDSIVLPVLYQQVPDFREIHYKKRVSKFIQMMLPSVLMACEKMDRKRAKVLAIEAAIFQGEVLEADSIYLQELKQRYNVERVDQLVKRLHPHPVSIILAQAAIESGWATSRFCREGNNIFGIWSYKSSEKRMVATKSRGKKKVYVRRYDSLFESVYDYLETIARVNAYKQFREVRLHSNNPYRLIWYLNNYSEKRYEYVRSLRNIIEYNDLDVYDRYKLAEINEDDEVWNTLLE